MVKKFTLTNIVSFLAIVSFVFGGYFYLEKRYALAQDLKKVEQRLEYKIVNDRLNSIQERIWKIEDRFENKPMDETTKEEYRKLQVDKNEAMETLKSLGSGTEGK
jgi:predicted mannosyl-3-phosphoglycerate phosphatase (HAD superfamily)